MIEKKIGHYSLENAATVYDEEAMTALELAARTAAKVNEAIDDINDFEHNVLTDVAPKLASEAVKKELASGDVAKAIEKKTGEAIEELIGGKVDGYVYVSSEGSVDIETIDNGGIKITISKPLVSAIKGYEFTDNSWAAIGTTLGELITIDGDAATITLPQFRRVLVLDLLDMTLKNRNYDNIMGTDYVLIANAYGNAVSGALMDAYLETQRKKNDGTPVAHYTVEKGYVYVSGGGKPKLTPDDTTGAIEVYIPAKLAVRFTGEFAGPTQYPHVYGALEWTDAFANTSMYNNATIEGASATIIVPDNNVLVFNMLDKMLYTRYHTSVKAHDYVLLKNGWANASGGAFYEMDLDRRIKSLESAPVTAFDPSDKLSEFTQKFKNISDVSGAVDSFMYFTDPHLAQNGEDWKPLMKSYIEPMRATYNRAPVSFVVGGGDWLGNSDTKDEACYKLGYIDGYMREAFKRYYPVNGNHDTNYQGKADINSANYTGQLLNTSIHSLMFRDYGAGKGKNYYSFETENALYVVFDGGVEGRTFTWTDTYEQTQLYWFDTLLKKNTKQNIVLFLHTIETTDGVIDNFARNVFEMASAFNRRTSDATDFAFTVDYTEGMGSYTGQVKLAMAGHLHKDKTASSNGIQYVLTTNLRNGNTPTYDLCCFDFDQGKYSFTRVGSGESRTIGTVTGGGTVV